jgi:hypothetical protein
MHFHSGILMLVDLVQQAYHSSSTASQLGGPSSNDISTLLYFCTLREALLDSFLLRGLRTQKTGQRVIERLFQDNRMARQKFGGLFTATTGTTWDRAVNLVSSRVGQPFEQVSKLMKQATELRNSFVHEGTAWSITNELSTSCLNSVPTMVELFVALHNEYARTPAASNA